MADLPDEKVYTVSELNRSIRALIEGALPIVWVEGEIANYVRHTSGHLYFSLRDELAQVRAVMFRRQNQFLRFEPEDGLRVVARGRMSLYERGGQYQIIVDLLQPSGIGPWELAFQQIHRKLEAEGLFDPEHKKPIPPFPQRVGVVTSPTGAAIADIIHVLSQRAPWMDVILRPAAVQGEGAAEEIARAVDEFNEYGRVDVLIVGRGGGSVEDLWAFNEEVVARSLFRSKIPVVSAVGHEIDHTISDLVADLRAPTPSAAAERVAPDRRTVEATLRALDRRSRAAAAHRARDAHRRLAEVARRWGGLRLETAIGQHAQRADELLGRLRRGAHQTLERREGELGALASRLNGVSPLGVLARGYCLCRRMPGLQVIGAAEHLSVTETVLLTFHRGEAVCSVDEVRPGE